MGFSEPSEAGTPELRGKRDEDDCVDPEELCFVNAIVPELDEEEEEEDSLGCPVCEDELGVGLGVVVGGDEDVGVGLPCGTGGVETGFSEGRLGASVPVISK